MTTCANEAKVDASCCTYARVALHVSAMLLQLPLDHRQSRDSSELD
eukprot:COSAG03_NODE_4106_length_1683_cov_1.707702_1_plen_45_part_10